MILDDVLRNPALRRALAAGEEQVGKVVGRLLASERVTAGLSGLFGSARSARETLDRGVRQALRAANLPSRDDVDALRRKLDELEALLDGLSERVARDDAPGERAEDPDAR